MKAILYKGPNQLELGELPRPDPGPDEVLLKVHNCGICGTDLHCVQLGLGLQAQFACWATSSAARLPR